MEKIYFISDLHFGAGTEKIETSKMNKLFSFLDYINHPTTKLFIVGDLFDFWFEYKHVIPKQNFHIFFQFFQLIKNGVQVHFLPGNHDYWTTDFFQNQIGFVMHPETTEVEFQSKKLFLFHGDGILKKDKGYRFLKKIFRNRFNIAAYRWLHPDIGVPLAKLTSHTSRQYTANSEFNEESDYIDFAMEKFKQGFDYVVLGHSHQPSIKIFNNNAVINLGDWMNHFSYGLLSDGKLSLNYWKI